jgi:hypothetical protein
LVYEAKKLSKATKEMSFSGHFFPNKGINKEAK